MRKRLRKKLRLGEYQHFAFEVRIRFDEDVDLSDDETFDRVIVTLYDELETDGFRLPIGWGEGTNYRLMIEPSVHVNREDAEWLRERVVQHIRKRPDVVDLTAGPVFDLYHEDYDMDTDRLERVAYARGPQG